MDPESFVSAFQGMPGIDPFMYLNLSGYCATTKLIQCRMYGVNGVEVSKKFLKDPKDVPDMGLEDFNRRKEILRTVEKWCASMKGKPAVIPDNTWRCINFYYEIVKSSGTRQRDFGHMLFTDYTLSRFLIVFVLDEDACKCGNPFHDDYATLAKHHADKMMSLVTYLHSEPDVTKPKWVRATYTTPSKKMHPDFLSKQTAPSDPWDTRPPIFHVTAENFIPSLSSDELEKIDNLRSQSSYLKPIPKSVRKLVRRREDEPVTDKNWLVGNESAMRECNWCRKVGTDFPQCSRCKLVRYCNAECQRAGWQKHKAVCKLTKNADVPSSPARSASSTSTSSKNKKK